MCAEQASLGLLSKAFRRQPGEFPKAPQVKCTWRLLVVSCADTWAHTSPHIHTQRGRLLVHTGVVNSLFPKGLCYVEPDSSCFEKREDQAPRLLLLQVVLQGSISCTLLESESGFRYVVLLL